jgi:crossover junction endodeoxyribonuclease RuvC
MQNKKTGSRPSTQPPPQPLTRQISQPLRILGIDPGYGRMGIAVLEKSFKGKEKLLHSDCIETSSKDDIYSRFKIIGQEIAKVIEKFKPQEMALESLFIAKNQKTAMRVAEVRGIILYEALKKDLEIYEYTPLEIKSSLTGDGTSDKTRIIKMIHLLIELPTKISLDDEYDAIAVALTHSARRISAKQNKIC